MIIEQLDNKLTELPILEVCSLKTFINILTRLDTWRPMLCAGGQGLYLRSLDHLGRSSEATDRKKNEKSKV